MQVLSVIGLRPAARLTGGDGIITFGVPHGRLFANRSGSDG
jgi:hypothetical protein